jgi:hypothetical protein
MNTHLLGMPAEMALCLWFVGWMLIVVTMPVAVHLPARLGGVWFVGVVGYLLWLPLLGWHVFIAARAGQPMSRAWLIGVLFMVALTWFLMDMTWRRIEADILRRINADRLGAGADVRSAEEPR